MSTPTSAQVQMYARIILYWIAGALVTHGYGTQSSWEPYVGYGVTIINFLWTLYGNRLMAKINELAATGQVSAIVVKDKATADAAPSDLVTAASETTVTKK
jgi:hypothetical protein